MENRPGYPKTFILALSLFSSNNRQARSFLTDKRLSQDEKKILQGFFDLRASKNEQALKNISPIESSSQYVRALKHLLMGCLYNHQSDFQNSLKHLKIAQKELAILNLPYFKFICVLNLFVIFHNLKNRAELDSLILFIKELTPQSPLEQFRILKCQFIYYCFIEEYQTAKEILTQIQQIKHESVTSDRSALLIDEFRFYLKQDMFDDCFKVLAQIKDVKIFYNSGVFNYMKTLLNFLALDKKLYFDLNAIKHQPHIYWEMKVIKSLDENLRAEATEAWSHLQKGCPEIYQDSFTYSSDKCLFSMSLGKVLENQAKGKVAASALPEEINANSVAEKILYFLRAEVTLKKEELYQKVFGLEPESKEDLQRLSKNIYKLNKKNKEQIIYHKGSYKLAS